MSLRTMFQRLSKGGTPVDELDRMTVALGEAIRSTGAPGVTKAEREAAIKESVAQFVAKVTATEPAALTKDDAKTCPECGGDMVDGVCEDCGYEADSKKPTDEETMKSLDQLEKAMEGRIAEIVKAETAELRKQLEGATAKNTELTAEVSKMKGDQATSVRVAKAQEMVRSTGQNPEAVATILAKIEGDEKAEAAFAGIMTALKKAQTEAELFKTLGSDGGPVGEGQEKIEQAAAELMKAEPKLTKAQAIAKAAKANPGEAYRETRSASR